MPGMFRIPHGRNLVWAVVCMACASTLLSLPASAYGAEGSAEEKSSRPRDSAQAESTPEGSATQVAVAASSDTVKLVRFFLTTETADLPPIAVPEFLRVDPQTLPKKLRPGYVAKRQELLALQRIVRVNRKLGPVRSGLEEIPPSSCGPPMKLKSLGLLGTVGFAELSEAEEHYLIVKTKCSECELRTEFTLTLAEEEAAPERRGKSRNPKRRGAKEKGPDQKPVAAGQDNPRYFLHTKDPLWALVGSYRDGTSPFGTSFFGLGGPPKCR